MIAGFKKCGIRPIDATPLSGRLPNANQFFQEDDAAAVDQSLIKMLSELHFPGPKQAKRSKKVKATSGKSVNAEHLKENDAPVNILGTSGSTQKKLLKKQTLPGKTRNQSKSMHIIRFR